MVSPIRMASQKKPPPATTQVSPELSRRCMKKRTTRTALVNAIESATTTLTGPRSTYDTATVASVSTTSAANTATYTRTPLRAMASDQVEHGEEEDPHDVDEVPVEPGHLDRVVVLGRVVATPGEREDHAHHADADDEVQCMHARHREVEEEEELLGPAIGARQREAQARHQPVLPLVPPLDRLDAEEDAAQEHGERQADEQHPAVPLARAVHRQHHGEARADEHDRVGAAEQHVEVPARVREGRRVEPAVGGGGGEHAAE